MKQALLPVHGFVLAGGKSSRMGQDKALLPFCGVPLIEVAVAKLRSFCANVSILGSRNDLQQYARVVPDLRRDIGPGAAFESALHATHQDWALFIPLDVPLIPAGILKRWSKDLIESDVPCSSFLIAGRDQQPAFSILHKICASPIAEALNRGERKLIHLLYAADEGDVAPVHPRNVRTYAPDATPERIEFWFTNVNTPQDFAEAQARAQAEGWQPLGLS